ncbi:MAG: protein kinase [Polyangiaceae bacterium]
MLRPGAKVADRFEIVRTIGSGGMGVVLEARELGSGARVALKLLKGEADGTLARRFVREAKLLVSLEHPNIVRYIAHGATDDGGLFIAMELLEGIDLHTRLRQAPLNAHDAARLGMQLASALGYGHGFGVIHRDVKPRNVFLVGGELEHAKVLDFGVARSTTSTAIATASEIVGTPGYISPEQARADQSLDARADVYSLGCLLFHAIAGKPPFAGNDLLATLTKLLLEIPERLDALVAGTPRELADLVASMLEKDRGARPASMFEVEAALARIAEATRDAPPSVVMPARERREAITGRERAHVAVVLATPPGGTQIEDQALDRIAATARVLFDATAARSAGNGLAFVLSAAGVATDQAVAAIRCAEHLRERLPRWTLAAAFGRGLVTGGLPIGEVIDRAAATLRETPQGCVGVDEACAALVETHFELRNLPSGLRVLERERVTTQVARTLLGKSVSCVGRQQELTTLGAMLTECIEESTARAVVLSGPPGIGKSRLLGELHAREIRPRGLEVWRARGEALSEGSPFSLLTQLLRSGFGVDAASPTEVQRTSVERWVQGVVAPHDAARVTTFLQEVMGLGDPDVSEDDVVLRAARQNPMQMGDLMTRAFEDLLVARLGRAPLVVVLDDLHWGDVPSLRFVTAALRVARDLPLFVLGVARPEGRSLFPAFFADPFVSELRVSPLSRKAAAKLVKQALPSIASDDAAVERIVERADGNAFFLEELVRTVAAGSGDALPATVLATVEARLRALSAEQRHVLRAASIFGQRAWVEGVATLLGEAVHPSALEQAVRALEASEILVRRPTPQYANTTEVAFRHALLRDAAYAGLTDEDRALGHRLAARWLEAAGERDAVLLAEHFERGGHATDAIRHYEVAASQALEGNDLAATLARAKRGLELGATGLSRARLLALAAEAQSWIGEHAVVVALSREARALLRELRQSGARDLGLELRTLRFFAEAAGRAGDRSALAEAASELEVMPMPTEQVDLYAGALSVTVLRLSFAGDIDRARALARKADALPNAPGCRGPASRIRNNLAQLALDISECIDAAIVGAEAFEELGDFRQALRERVNLGNAYIQVGEIEKAETALRGALAIAERMGLPIAIANAKSNLGHALLHLGRLDEAKRFEREACDMFTAQGDSRLEATSRVYLARILAADRDFIGALSEAERALAVAPSEPDRVFALTMRASLRLACEEYDGALADATEAVEMLDAMGGIDEGEIWIRLTYGEALLKKGRVADATFAVRFAMDRLEAQLAMIKDPAMRASALARIVEHARLRELAETLGQT